MTTEAALAVSRNLRTAHGGTQPTADRPQRVRCATPWKSGHESFVDPAFVALLRKYRVALVVADTAGKWPYREDLTGDFVYIRLHGAEKLYTSGYTDEALDRWCRRIRRWNKGSQPDDAQLIDPHQAPTRHPREVYCYFDNDVKVRAPYDARQLLQRLGLDQTLSTTPGPRSKEHSRDPGKRKTTCSIPVILTPTWPPPCTRYTC